MNRLSNACREMPGRKGRAVAKLPVTARAKVLGRIVGVESVAMNTCWRLRCKMLHSAGLWPPGFGR